MTYSTTPCTFPTPRLKEWFLSVRRTFPWRDDPTPYKVWISEIMLQQTQAQVVIPYFEKWMKEFPTIQALARASLEHVIKVWEGLGYYSRARFIQIGAQQIVEKYHSQIPQDLKELSTIKGIGPYTRGAIFSFAFHQKAPAVDGNVMRLLSRFFLLEEPIDLPSSRIKIENLVMSILPDVEPWVLMEAMIELGALVCKKKPKCVECPLKENCLAFRHGRTVDLPVKKGRQTITSLEREVAVVVFKNKYLLQKGMKGKIMADLYEFPYLEKNEKHDLISRFENELGLSLTYVCPLFMQRQSFTHFRVQLFPHLFEAKYQDPQYIWKDLHEIKEIPFSAGHRRILKDVIIRFT